ncbi:unnamed protein product [Nezara viridula]|uniref:Cyclin B n=1 Tax=Nezara viridula TaxID=85310 RepID=A0A9P0MU16_NEZVI|nr:unnamed protein product [Nezara viridula]
MQRFKVYKDVENDITDGKPLQRYRKRQALGEIKNTIITRSKYSEINEGFKRIRIEDEVKQESRRTTLRKKATGKRAEIEDETNKSPLIRRRRRLSSLFRVSEYANDIYKYLQRIEDKYPIMNSEKMENMVGEDTRFALVDCLVEINEHFKFVHETLQLSVSIIDRCVQEQASLTRKGLELIALAAVFIASKYEELVPIEISDLLQVCGSLSSTEEVLQTEMKIVTEVQCSLGRPVPAHFVRRYCKVAQANSVLQSCAFYLTDVALMSYKLCYFKPSIIAATSLFIALCVSNGAVDQRLWNPTLIKYSTYEIEDLEDCAKVLAKCLKRTKSSSFRAIEKKYSKPMFFDVPHNPNLQTVLEALAM